MRQKLVVTNHHTDEEWEHDGEPAELAAWLSQTFSWLNVQPEEDLTDVLDDLEGSQGFEAWLGPADPGRP